MLTKLMYWRYNVKLMPRNFSIQVRPYDLQTYKLMPRRLTNLQS